MAVGQLTRVNVAPGRFDVAEGTLYIVPANQKIIYVELTACNTDDTTEYTFDLHFIPNGSSRSADNQVINGVANVSGLRPGESVFMSWNPFLDVGDTIRGLSNSALKIAYRLSLVLEEV